MNSLLIIIVGFVAGALLVWLIDNSFFGQKLIDLRQEATQFKNRAVAAEKKAATSSKRIRHLTRQLSEIADRSKRLREENGRIQTELTQFTEQLDGLKGENERICDRLQHTEVEAQHLRESLSAAEEWQEQATHLRDENDEISQKLEAADLEINQLTAQISGALQQVTETQSLRKQIVAAEEKLKATYIEVGDLQSRLKEVQNKLTFTRLGGKEDLTLIKGIGPAYAKKLQAGGIKTLADLSQATPEKLSDILQIKKWQNSNLVAWVEQANELAGVFTEE